MLLQQYLLHFQHQVQEEVRLPLVFLQQYLLQFQSWATCGQDSSLSQAYLKQEDVQ